MKRSPGSRREPESVVRTVCQECSVACGLAVSIAGGAVVDVQGDEDHPVSRGRLCARGSAFAQGLTSQQRIVAPAARKRRGDEFKPFADWKPAVDALAERLREVRQRHGADALVIACDRDGGLDFAVGAQRFAQLWGTSQVFHSAPVLRDPWPGELDHPAAPCTDWLAAGALVLVEADVAATHPVAFQWIQEAQRRGTQVIAADARLTATLAHADVALRTRPGRGNLLGLALAKLLVPEGAAGAVAFPDAAAWRASLAAMSLDGAEAALGVSLEALQKIATILAGRGPVTVITGRALAAAPHHRTWLALARAMGWAGKRGGGWYPLDAGGPTLDACAGLPAVEAKPAPSLAEVTARGPVHALICSGDALTEHVAPFGGVADQADLVVHFGSFPNATWGAASLTFPALLWPERNGLFFGGDRTVERGRALVEPPKGCRSGLDFWIELARRFGWDKSFPWATEDGRADLAAFDAWVLAGSAPTACVSLDALQEAKPGATSWALADAAVAAPPVPASLAAAVEAAPDPAFPLALVASASASRSGDASGFWDWTRGLVKDDGVQLHPDTAGRLGIENGDDVVVDTPRGALAARATLTRRVAPWAVGSPKALAGVAALVRRPDQTADAARALLAGTTP